MIADTYTATIDGNATQVTHTYSPAIGRISDDRWEQMQMTWRCESALAHGKGNHKRRTFIDEHTLIMQLDEFNWRYRNE
jgi:hypothetical protein